MWDERMWSIVTENRRESSELYFKVDNLDIASSANLRHSPRVTVAERAHRVQIYEPNTRVRPESLKRNTGDV